MAVAVALSVSVWLILSVRVCLLACRPADLSDCRVLAATCARQMPGCVGVRAYLCNMCTSTHLHQCARCL
eukprot:4032870-Alexandrium_andersonii.AAC.1